MKGDYSIVVRKRERKLEVYKSDVLVRSFAIVLGFAPEEDKEVEGDGKTPEGEFYIFGKNPESKFYLSLGVSYPSTEDAERGLEAGILDRTEYDSIVSAIQNNQMPPQETGLGGEIYVHGGGIEGDWTCGCIAMRNEDIEELYNLAGPGTKITIHP